MRLQLRTVPKLVRGLSVEQIRGMGSAGTRSRGIATVVEREMICDIDVVRKAWKDGPKHEGKSYDIDRKLCRGPGRMAKTREEQGEGLWH